MPAEHMEPLFDLLFDHWIWATILALFLLFSFWTATPSGKRSAQRSRDKAAQQFVATQARNAPPTGFVLTQKLLGIGKTVGVALDERNREIWLINHTVMRKRILEYNELLSVELSEDGQSLSAASRKSQAAGIIIGGLALGGFGALVGGLTPSRRQTALVDKLTLRLVINDSANPIHEVVLLNTPRTLKTSAAYQQANALARHWQAALEVIMRQADEADRATPTVSPAPPASIADELRKLGLLRQEGLLSDSEFQAQKAKLLNAG